MAKKNSAKNSAMEEYLNNKLNECLAWTAKKTWDINKRILINTFKQLKPVNIKGLFKSKEKYAFIIVTVGITTYFIVKTYDTEVTYMSCTGLLSYFYGKGVAISIKDQYLKQKENFRVAQLCRKNKKLIELFEKQGDIKVMKEYKDKITVYSRDITNKQLVDYKERLEMFFNRNISVIARQKSNFSYNDIIFFRKTSFDRFYKLEDYINYVDLKVIRDMFLPLVLGIDENNKMLIMDLADSVHVFISGESGGGKSTIVNSIIQSLMVFVPNVSYIFIDLKMGVEMIDYNTFPNCMIVSTIEGTLKVVQELEKEMKERVEKIKKFRNCKSIQAYNAKPENKNNQMNYIVCVIDEAAIIRGSGKKDIWEEIERILLIILQQSRIAGIHLIGATQRPSGKQVSTELRGGFLHNISFAVKTSETQRMTKCYGTESLNKGEFKTTYGDKDTIYKGFLIAEEENKKKKIPKCNYVFEVLEAKLNNKVCLSKAPKPIEICLSNNTDNNNIWNKILSKFNKKAYQKTHQKKKRIKFENLIKPTSKQVIESLSRFRQLDIRDENLPGKSYFYDADADFGNDKKYIKFLLYVYENQKDDSRLPERKLIEQDLNISSRKREDFTKKAFEEKYLDRVGRYTISNNNIWNKILK